MSGDLKMKKSLAKNKNFNYVAFLLLVLLLSISLAACGSTTVEDLNNIVNPQDNNYEISGYGEISLPLELPKTIVINNLSLTGGDFYFHDLDKRLQFRGSTVNSIAVSGNTITIFASGELQEATDVSYSGGYSIEITIVDDNVDMFSIEIALPDGSTYNLGPYAIDMVNGNFTITTL